MSATAIGILAALFGWWVLTGIILFLNHLPERTYRWSLSGAGLLLLGSLAALPALKHDTTTTGAIVAFLLALLIWGWLEMSYLMGVVTGPRSLPCPDNADTRERFSLALQTSLHHEIAVVVLALVVFALCWGGVNQVAALTFCALWLMRWSAKLNLFLGVRNYNLDWLPRHLRYLDSYTRRRRMNALFPLSVLAGGVAAFLCFSAAADGAAGFATTGYTLVGTLLSLAVLEHLFLMLPLRDAVLWQWALPEDSGRSGPG
jgi:putative photosynthetic complex assembly protein 2